MTRIKRILFTLAASLGLLVPASVPAIVSAETDVNIRQGLCAGASFDPNSNCVAQADTAGTNLQTYITTAINIFSIVVGIIAVIMIIIGGVKYITSGGDAGNVTGAKNTILYAIIGLVVVALSQIIVQFVLGSFAGA
jgi:uncharacterized membrane protein YidH (DUF202 family)